MAPPEGVPVVEGALDDSGVGITQFGVGDGVLVPPAVDVGSEVGDELAPAVAVAVGVQTGTVSVAETLGVAAVVSVPAGVSDPVAALVASDVGETDVVGARLGAPAGAVPAADGVCAPVVVISVGASEGAPAGEVAAGDVADPLLLGAHAAATNASAKMAVTMTMFFICISLLLCQTDRRAQDCTRSRRTRT